MIGGAAPGGRRIAGGVVLASETGIVQAPRGPRRKTPGGVLRANNLTGATDLHYELTYGE